MAQKTRSLQKGLNILANSLLVAGLLLILLSIVLTILRYNPGRLNFGSGIPLATVTKTSEKLPTHINISASDINLPIYPSTIKDTQWETTDNGVSYLNLSPVPGEKGNSILYGHNWTNILGNLTKVKPGQTVRISYNDGSNKTFIVENTAMVSPKNIAVLLPSDEPLLTIYTCAGLFDTKRFVVTARPV